MRVFIWIVIGLMAIIFMGDYVPEDKGIVYQVVAGIGLVFVAITYITNLGIFLGVQKWAQNRPI
jgi:fatty-acid desaturase